MKHFISHYIYGTLPARGKEKPFGKGSFLPPLHPLHPFPKLFVFAFSFFAPQKAKSATKFPEMDRCMTAIKVICDISDRIHCTVFEK